MIPPPAYAESADLSDSSFIFVMAALGEILLVFLLALVPIALAHARRHRRARGILITALLWAFLAAGSSLLTTSVHLKWSKEQMTLLSSGYYNPAADTAGAPGWPWPLWIILAAAYVALLVFALAPNRRPGPARQPSPRHTG